MKKVLKKLFVFLLGFMATFVIVYAATLFSATEVSYDNSSSGTSNTNVQGAVDELYLLSQNIFHLSASSSAPAYTGKEGELVVITNQNPSKYYISNEQPNNPSENSIWLVESNGADYQLKTTNVSTSFHKVKQYINSVWVDVPCYIYQNNKWNLIPVIYDFDYTGDVQTFTVPYTGTYKLEVWGAQGGNSNCTGGYGGYSKGEMYMNSNDTLYVVVGGQGNGDGAHGYRAGGYNGGGNANSDGDRNTHQASGGGATHIATTSGLLSSLSSNRSAIIIVAGGGGGGAANAVIMCTNGGCGGGYHGENGGNYYESSNVNGYGVGATDSQPGGAVISSGIGSPYYGTGSFGAGASSASVGGGGGYFGGGAGLYSGGGGSGYIGNSSLTNQYMYCYNCSTSSVTSTKTYTTTNVSETPISDYAKKGNGYAKITYVG